MTRGNELVPHGSHPMWCEMIDDCAAGKEPWHIGRTSTLYGQTGEMRFTLQLRRGDEHCGAGNRTGDNHVLLALLDMALCNADGSPRRVDAHLTVDEARMLALQLVQYVEFAEVETTSVPAEHIEENVKDLATRA